MKLKRLTVAYVREYLCANLEREFNTGDAEYCPLAECLPRSDDESWIVGPCTIVAPDDREYDAPAWAARFQSEVDGWPRAMITGAEALALLESVAGLRTRK